MDFLTVELNDFSRQWDSIGESAAAAFRRVGGSGWYVLGSEVAGFEAALARSWPIGHVIGTGTGLDALEIALRCLGVGAGDLVLTTPLSSFASTLAVLRAGAIPVFADVDRCGLLDLALCRKICAQEPRIRCLLVVHLYGCPLDLEALESLKRDFQLNVVEDCAQSIGATWKGRATGTVGQISATSFYPTKNLGSLGDGGAVLTSSSDLADRSRALRDYGRTSKYVHDEIGLNSRLDECQAAILGDALLPRLSEWAGRRRAIASRYRAEIRNRWLELPEIPPQASSNFHLFPVLAPPGERDSFVRFLKARGIMTGCHYPRLIPEQRALVRYCDFQVLTELDQAKRFAENEVSLPVHHFLTDEEVDHVIGCAHRWSPA